VLGDEDGLAGGVDPVGGGGLQRFAVDAGHVSAPP
jgi:hypothetical protein